MAMRTSKNGASKKNETPKKATGGLSAILGGAKVTGKANGTPKARKVEIRLPTLSELGFEGPYTFKPTEIVPSLSEAEFNTPRKIQGFLRYNLQIPFMGSGGLLSSIKKANGGKSLTPEQWNAIWESLAPEIQEQIEG